MRASCRSALIALSATGAPSRSDSDTGASASDSTASAPDSAVRAIRLVFDTYGELPDVRDEDRWVNALAGRLDRAANAFHKHPAGDQWHAITPSVSPKLPVTWGAGPVCAKVGDAHHNSVLIDHSRK